MMGRDGRLRSGSYLYLVMCQDGEPHIFIKIGYSQDPYRRLAELSTSCPLKPTQLATCGVRSTSMAKRLERLLLDRTMQWHVRGEWRRVPIAEKGAFNSVWKTLFEIEGDYACPLRWDVHSAAELRRRAKARKMIALNRLKRRGAAYRDFVRHNGGRLN